MIGSAACRSEELFCSVSGGPTIFRRGEVFGPPVCGKGREKF
ncbi:hypothetical protein HMPREF0889_0438 [Megasphaera lornae]|uniref:Uncharacterized protein n=1 Tax=Megasphaera lornae TaxID=1000568 RepID=D3LW02_9FIRM|nr:hypothetical protein HMPREF0889_0438 [Megasphaera genomosp. type_1 str. 28L]